MIEIIDNYDFKTPAGHFQSKIIYTLPTGFGGIIRSSPLFLNVEDSKSYFESVECTVYLQSLESFYKHVLSGGCDIKRLADMILYCLQKEAPILEICQFVVKLEAGIRKSMEVIKLPARLEYVKMFDEKIMLHVNNKLR